MIVVRREKEPNSLLQFRKQYPDADYETDIPTNGINFIIGKYIGDWCISRSDYNHRNIGYRRNIW